MEELDERDLSFKRRVHPRVDMADFPGDPAPRAFHSHAAGRACASAVATASCPSDSLVWMPPPEAHPSIGKVRTRHVGKLLVLSGTVIRTGLIKTVEAEHALMCNKCKFQ